MIKGYISTVELTKYFDISPRTLARWQKRDSHPFPRPRICGSSFHNRWAIDDVEEWEKTVYHQNKVA